MNSVTDNCHMAFLTELQSVKLPKKLSEESEDTCCFITCSAFPLCEVKLLPLNFADLN